ncbi:hypothetical protein JCM10213_003490 [Rhodosporidiobolus nylandii]
MSAPYTICTYDVAPSGDLVLALLRGLSLHQPIGTPSDRILHFPDSILDRILAHVAELEDELEDEVAMRTYYSWTLTHPAFVASGQRALYRVPYRCSRLGLEEARAKRFLQTLEEKPELASYVRNMGGLLAATTHFWMNTIFALSPLSTFDYFTFQDTLLYLCTRLDRISFVARSVIHAGAVGALCADRETLTKLHVCFLPGVSEHKALSRLFAPLTLPSKVYDLVHMSLSAGVVEEDEEPLPFKAVMLVLDAGLTSGERIIDFIPSSPADLKYLCISTKVPQVQSSLRPLFEHLRNGQLVGLSFRGPQLPATVKTLQHYDAGVPGLELPVEAFSSYPNLTSVTLRHLTNMSLAKLSVLVQTSPNLQDIDLEKSVWTFRSQDFRLLIFDEYYGRRMHGEQLFIDILKNARALLGLSTGVLPYLHHEVKASKIARWCRTRRIVVYIEACSKQ